MRTKMKTPLGVEKSAIAALALVTLAVLAPGALGAADDSFEIFPDLRAYAGFSCQDLKFSGEGTVRSLGLASGTAESGQGHLRSNADITLNGAVEVDGDVLAGPDGRVRLLGGPIVTGNVDNADVVLECHPIDFALLEAALDQNNDNHLIPLTSLGEDVLGGADGREFKIVGADSLTLPAGSYIFSSFEIGGGSTVEVDGEVRILVTGDVKITGGGVFNQGGSPFLVRLWSSGETFRIESQSILGGFVYAPAAESLVTGGAELRGAIYTAELDINGGGVLTRIIDDAQPQLAITSPSDGDALTECEVEVVGTAMDGETDVDLTINGIPVVVEDDGSFSTVTSLWTDPHGLITAIATDGDGNTTTVEIQVTVLPPVVTLELPPPGSLVDQRVIALTGSAGTATEVTVNGVSATVADGVWQIAAFDLGEDGLKTLVMIGANCGGDGTSTAGLDLDTTPPVVAFTDPPNGKVIGDTTVTVTGTVIDAHLESVEVNGISAVIAGDTFSVANVPLVEGINTLTATAIDGNGLTSTAQLSITVDTLAPVVTITAPSDGGLTTVEPITVVGGVTEANLESLTINGIVATVTGGQFSAEIGLAEGPNTITATATDVLDRTGSATITVTLDTTAPGVTITEPVNGSVADAVSITVSGSFTEVLSSLTVNGLAATFAGGVFSVENVPLDAEGDNFIIATATDLAGNSADSLPTLVVRDTLPPTITMDTTALPALTESATLIVTGTATDPHLESVTVAGVAATIAGDQWTVELTLAEGASELVATAEDSVGHSAQTPPFTVVLDTVPPVIEITSPTPGSLFSVAAVTVEGTVSDPNLDDATVVVNGETATVNGDLFTVELVLAEGEADLVAQATDLVGHVGASSPVAVIVDTLAPVVTLTEPLELLVSTATVEVTGTVTDPHLEQVTVNGVAATIAGDQFTVTGVPLVEGSNLLTATATDTFGHSADSNAVEFILDSTIPEIAITAPPEGELIFDATVTVTGTVADVHLESVEVNGHPAVIDGGVFTVENVPLIEGTNVLTAVARDSLDLIASASVTVVRDSSPPAVAIVEPALGSCVPAGQPITVSGTVFSFNLSDGLDGNPPPMLLEVTTTDGVTASFPPVITADGRSWSVDSIDVGSADGTAIITATANDIAGRTGVAAASLRVDATPPVLTLLLDGGAFPGAAAGETPPPGTQPVLLNRVVAARVSVADGAFGAPEANLTLDGLAYVPGTPIDAEGDHLLVAAAIDCAGHPASVHALFSIDLTAPTLVGTTPIDGEQLTEGPAAYSGIADTELASATINGSPAVIAGAGFNLSPISWREGDNAVEIVLTDPAGNQANFQRSFSVSTIEPTVEILDGGLPIPDAAIYTRPVTPEVRATPVDATIDVTLDGAPFILGAALDATGDYTLVAIATDGFGRTATDSVSFRVDLEAGPTIAITTPVDGAVLTEASALVNGTVSGSAPTVTVNGLPAVVTGGAWTIADLSLEPDVLNLISAIATDSAGRTASATVSVMVRTGGGQVLILEPVDGASTNRVAIDVVGAVVGGADRTVDGTVTVNGIVTPVAPDGSFRTLDVPLASGANLITAEVTDPEDRTDTDTITVHTDLDPPAISLAADGAPLDEGAVFTHPVILTITISDNMGEPPPPIVTLNGNPQPADAATVAVPVTTDGGYLLAVTAFDAAGNERRAERSFTITGGGCGLADLEPADGSSVAQPAATIRGRSGSAESVTIRVPIPDTSPVVYDDYTADLADGTFVAGGVPLPAIGDNALEIVCTGAGGATAVEALTIHRLPDGDGPAVEITSPAESEPLSVRTITVAGTVSDFSSAVTVNGRSATVTDQGDGSGIFTVDLPLTEGPNVLAARALDAVGRAGADRVIVWLDTRAPPVTITSPENTSWHGPRSDGSAVVDVSGLIDIDAEPNLVDVVVSTTVGSVTATVDPDTGDFLATGVPLDAAADPSAIQTVTVTAADSRGHTETAEIGVHFDAAGPAIVLVAPPDLGRYHEGSPPNLTVSGEAWAAEGSSVSINGATIDPTILTWDGPVPDGRFHTTFSLDILRATDEGPVGVIARITQLDGRWAGTRRLLFVDATPPEILEIHPADGSEGVDADSLVLVLFSEPILHSSLSSAGGLSLTRLDTGDPVVGQLAVSGTAVAFVPGAALAPSVDYRFSVGAGVTDLVGHPIAVPQEVVFSTAADAIATAPQLDPALPSVVCASSLSVTGTAAPNTTVRVRDGDLSFTGTADPTGAFTVHLPLTGDGFHVIEVAAVDRSGTAGSATTSVVRVDCSGPQVDLASLDITNSLITLELSEAVDPVTATIGFSGAAIRLFDDNDPAAGDQQATVQLSPDGATIELLLDSAPDAWWRDTVIRLVVAPPLADDNGIVMGAPFETLLFPTGGGGLAGGFLFGETYDDTTGRPLEGATAHLYLAGSALPGAVPAGAEDPPLAFAVTDARGRYQITDEVAPGRYTFLLEAGEHVRVVRQLSLEPATGTIPFDSRLTPMGDEAGVLDPVAGGTLAHPDLPLLQLVAQPAAVDWSTDLTVHLVPRSGQGLPDALPLGWTPLAAADLVLTTTGDTVLADGDGTPFDLNAVHLDLPLPDWVVATDQLVAVRYHLSGGQWLTVADVEFVTGPDDAPIARVELVGPGSVAVVLPDAGDGAPPLPALGAGNPLRGVGLPDAMPELTATLTLDPPVVPPTGRATASVVALSANGSTPWPSGLAVQAYLEEQLILSGGVERIIEAPYVADLLLYRSRLEPAQLGGNDPESAGAVDFVVSPSDRAAEVLLDVGYENIRLYPFPGQLERGQILGPGGGTVTSADGVELSVPEGALPSKTIVQANQLAPDELAALPAIVGYDTIAAVRIELGGHTLARAATLGLDVPAGAPDAIPGDPRLILAELIEAPADGRGAYPELTARIDRAAGRLTAAPEAPDSGLVLDGLRREGLLLVLHAQAPMAYATGFVTASNGFGIELARVTNDSLGTADLSALGGRYAIPIQASPGTIVEAAHPASDESGSAGVAAVSPAEIIALDIVIVPVAPTVLEVSPADGAIDQPVGAAPSVLFSEELNPATIGPGSLTLVLADASGRPTGASVAGSVSLNPDGTRIVFSPDLPLAPGRTWVATFSGGVTDAGGTPYAGGPISWNFTTSTVVAPGGQVHPELFRIRMPVDGVAEIYGEPGALPVSTPAWSVSPFVVRDANDPVRDTFSADTLGGFTGTVGHPPDFPVTIAHEVWVDVFDHNGELAVRFRFDVFSSPDGRGFVAPVGMAVSYAVSERITVEVPEGAFDQPTLVTVTELDVDDVGVAPPTGLAIGAYIDVDFEGEANETLRLKVRAPEGINPTAQVFIGEPTNYPWGKRIRMLSVGGVLVEGVDDKFLSNDPSLQPEPEPAGNLKDFGQGTWNCQDALEEGLPQCFLQSLLYEFAHRSTAAFFYEQGAEWTVMAFGLTNFPMSVGFSNSVFYNFLADIFVYVPVAHDWSGHVVLPVLEDSRFQLIERDAATGWIINEHDEIFVPENPEALFQHVELDARNLERPLLVGAYPFDFLRFNPDPGERQELRLELAIETTENGTFTIVENETFPLSDGTGITLLDMDPNGNMNPDSGDWNGPYPQIDPVHLCSFDGLDDQHDAEREHLLIVGSGDLDPNSIDAFRFQFDRGLDPGFSGFEPEEAAVLYDLGSIHDCNQDLSGSPTIPLEVTLSNSNSQIVLTPVGKLPAGHSFVIELQAEAISPPGNNTAYSYANWTPPLVRFPFSTRPVPGDDLTDMMADSIVNTTDLMQFGNLTMVATRSGEIYAVDSTNTTELVPADGVTPEHLAPGQYTVHAEYSGGSDHIRAFATDGHNRLFFNARVFSAWTLKAIAIEDVRNAEDGVFEPVQGYVKTAYSLGAGPPVSASEWLALGAMPSGTPADLEIVVQDEVGDALDLYEFAERYEASLGDPDDEGLMSVSLTLESTNTSIERTSYCQEECPYDRFQRVTIKNLTTGQSWSQDIENEWNPDDDCPVSGPGSSEFEVTARAGDRLQVRHNITTLGYVAIVGSGITVVDLNRMYRVPLTNSPTWGPSQCYRRLGQYQGQDINFPSCANGLRNGIDMTPAVAVLGDENACPPPPDEPRRSDIFKVNTYSPLTHVNLVHSVAQCGQPGDLSLKEEISGCLKAIKTGVVFDHDEGQDVWVKAPVSLRDVAVARGNTWIDRGITGTPDGIFETTETPTQPEKTVDLLFASLGDAGIYVYDVSSGDLEFNLVGNLRIDGHSIHRLQVDENRNLLFAGGYGPSKPVIQIWDISSVNGAPNITCGPDVLYCPEGTDTSPRPLVVLHDVPWTTNHLALDETGTGLLRTIRGGSVVAVPFSSPQLQFIGLFAPEEGAVGPLDDPQPASRAIQSVVPLGVPMEVSLEEEENQRAENDRASSAVVKLRVALPGSVGHEVTAKIQSLRVLPDRKFIGQEDLGLAVADFAGDLGPSSEVVVTLRRIGLGDDEQGLDLGDLSGETGPLSNAYDLYESLEKVVLISDPRAWTGYDRQDVTDDGANGSEHTRIADEEGQCRRCSWPDFLPDPDTQDPEEADELRRVKELVVTGPYLRAFLFVPEDCDGTQVDRDDPEFALCGNVTRDGLDNTAMVIDFLDTQGANYRKPGGAVEVAAWLDDVPSPIQVSLAEPALNPSIWSTGEAGVAVSLVSGEGMLSAADHSVPGRSLSFLMSRTYRSGFLGTGPLGPGGWTGRLFAHLREIPTTGEVEYHDGAGHVWRYYPDPGLGDDDCQGVGGFYAVPGAYDVCNPVTGYIAPKGLFLDLTRTPTGGWRLVGRHRESMVFDPDGRLVEFRDRHRGGEPDPDEQGSTMYLTHDIYGQLVHVEDDLGRRYRLTYYDDPQNSDYGLLKSVTDFGDREIEYAYDDEARLQNVRLPEVTIGAGEFVADGFPFEGDADDRPTLTYSYYDAGASGGIPENADDAILHGRFAKFRIEGFTLPEFPTGQGQVADGLRVRLTYQPISGRVAKMGFPLGDEFSEWSVDEIDPPNNAAPSSAAAVTAPWEHERNYTIEKGRTKVIEEQLQVRAGDGTISSPDLTTRFDYEDDGRLKEQLRPDGSAQTIEYEPDPYSRREVANPRFITITAGGTPLPHDPPRTGINFNEDNIPNNVIDAVQRQIGLAVPTVPSAEEQLEKTIFHPFGPTETGVSRSYKFDTFGRAVEIFGGEQQAKSGGGEGPKLNLSYGFDAKGRANAGLVESATQGNGLKQSFEYDQFDNLNKVQDETFGKQSQAITDEWGRPVSVASGQAKSGSLLAPVGSGPCSGSPWLENGGMLTDRAFDAAGHLVRERSCQDYIDAAGEIDQRWVETRYHYNRREQLVRIEKNNLAAPGLAGQWNPGFHDILLLGYDEKGRLKTQTVPNQETEPLVTTFNYDPAGRMDGVFVGNGAVRVQGYDVNGRVNYRSDGDAGTWFAEYDALDRVFREYLPTGARVERQFDAAGNVLNERVFDSADGRMLSRTATYFTSFGLADMTIDFLAESPDSGDDLRITKRFFDASGRTSAVVSGPVLDLGGLNDIFTLQLDPDKDRLEMEILYEPLSNRPIDRFYGGCYDPQHPDNCAAEYQEHMIYKAPDIAVPWPDQIDVFERVPSQSTLVLTGSTEFVRDVQGRPLEVKSSDGSLLITTYDRMGGAIRTQTGAGTVNLSIFDGGGLLLRRLRPSPRGSTAYAYDVDGRKLAQITQNEAGDPLWSTVFHYDSTNNSRGLVSQIDHPDGSNETFFYNPDDTVYQWTNRDLLTLGYTYDAANRPRRVEPDGTPPTSMIPLDDGDFKEFDALSRIDIVDRAPFDGPSTPFKVDYSDYDLGGRPTEETVGERPPLAWSYDVFDRPTNVTLPEGVGRDAGDPFTGYERSWDTLDRLTGVGGVDTGGGVIPDIGADWVWGGAGRLYGITSRGPLATAVRYGYIGIAGPELPPGSPEGSLGKLGTLTYGAGDAGPTSVPTHTWGAFGYGWRGAGVDGERQDGMKIGRKVLTDGAGLLASMGWSWHLDNGLRLEDAHAGLGSLNENDSTGSFETFGFKYREGDQLEWMSRTTGELVQYEHSPAPYGRIEARDDVAYGYDRSGRRTTDDRFSYRWDWRGRLYEVTILEDAGTLFDGHQVRYEYDALGRLFHRVHLGEDPGDGNRPFIEYRAYLWEGNGLLAEAGYGSHDGTWDDPDTDLFLRWRKSYVPGASGLDDAVQVRVQTVLPEATDNVYSYLRDELGTVLGLVEEVAGADPEAPPLLVRYLYTPYGEVHAESGPELRAVVFDNDVTEVVTTTGTVTQTIENPASHAQGVLELTLSLPADEAALAAGLTLTDAETETTLAQGVGYVIGRPEDDPATLQILPLAGWERSHDYRVELKTDLVDSVGRALVHERSFVWDIPAAGAVGSPPQPDLTPSYDSIVAASSDLGGAFPGGQTALFQGLWTDPVTGIAYARNRWYDARTASWLSEDPMGAVDSPNLYAFVGWGPHMYTDPYGYWSWDPASGYRWVQARVGEAKDFYSSSDSVALDAVGNTLSDLGGGIGSVLNIGTNTGETYVEEGGFHDLESTALITAAGLGDLSETILAATGAASTAVKTAQTVRQVQQLRRIKRELQAATSSEQTGELLAQRELVRRGFDIGPDVKIRGKQGEGAGNQGVDLVFERKNVISPDKSITVESKSVNFPELKNDTRQIQQATDEFNRTRLDRAADPRLSSPDTIREATRLQELREANRLKSYKSVYDPVSGTVKFYEVVSDESGTQVLEEVTTRLLSTGF